MRYINSKRYGSSVQLYHKRNGDISYYITYKDENNKLKRIKIGDKSKGITENFCNEKRIAVIHSVKLGDDVPIKYKKEKGIIFNELAEKYMEYISIYVKENTLKDVRSKYRLHLKKYIGDKNVESITSDDLEQIQKDKVQKLSAKTVNMLIDTFSAIVNYGIKKELCNIINPATRIKRFKVNNVRDRYLETDELDSLYEEISDIPVIMLFVRLSLCTGGRMDTILHIQKKDININRQMVILKDLKNNDTYRGFLSDDVIPLLKNFLSKQHLNDYVVSFDGTKLTPRQIQCRLKPKLDKLFNMELEFSDRKNRVVIHTLRHTFASHLAINGTPIYTIQRLLNHKDIKQTMRYAKLSPESGREFINDLYKV